ncbi:MAG TPA: MMPL family transporter [Haliangiales bacterium]|nr:MMPL family transporter [Haliangiales bacterium]
MKYASWARHWLWVLLLIPIGLGLARLRFDVEVLDLLPADVPAVQGLQIYQQNFANARELIITVRAPDAEAAENAARALAMPLRHQTHLISRVTWQPPWLEQPAQAAEFVAYLWFNQPPEVFGQLTNRLATNNVANVLDSAREQLATSLSPDEVGRLSYDPFGLLRLPENTAADAPAFGQGQEQFASADGTFRILFVQAQSTLSNYRECVRWLNAVKQIVDVAHPPAERSRSGILFNYTGRPAFVAEIAGGMEHDITGSVGCTVLVIVALFWWVHRRWRPLLWILALLALILGSTLALGGLFFGTLNVVSVGFAAILLGLAVDYGLVLYQESLGAPHRSARDLRRTLAPSIVWSAVTTAGAFLILNFGGLPGLAQLGSLVAIGIALAAVVMLNFFLPPLLRSDASTLQRSNAPTLQRSFTPAATLLWTATVLLLFATIALLSRGLPAVERTADSLRPRHSSAYAALEDIKRRMGRTQEPYWLLMAGRDESEVARRLDGVQPILQRAAANKLIDGFTLAAALWPRPEFQSANRPIARQLAAERELLHAAARAGGFTGDALAATDNILSAWKQAASTPGVVWPTNDMSRWILEKMAARTPTNFYALGLIYPVAGSNSGPRSAGLSTLGAQLPRDGVWLAGWEMLGSALLDVVEKDFRRVMLPMTALLVGSLWLAFGRFREVLLSLAALAFSLLCLLALMKLAGWSWNLLNLMALPLLLGSGVDYSIHMQLALRRHGGDITASRRTVGRALFLCAATTVTGFGSNVWSSNGGLVSLGQVCASGIAFAYLTSTFLLPIWWKTLLRNPTLGTDGSADATAEEANDRASRLAPQALLRRPSFLYRAEFWQLGLGAARKFSPPTCVRLSRTLVGIYGIVARKRREVVIRNLLPPLNGDRAAAEKVSRDLLQNFAIKLADLWRYESGASIDALFAEWTGWEYFTAAQSSRRGILLLTPHLGNWEFGAPLLAQRGVKLLVVTLAEPQGRLTELRQASRARWGIETLVIGRDPFAFVEIIRRLESGAIVALLVDRPPEASAVMVELFGRKFAASIAAAELARASGCVLLPVYLPRTERGYAAHILPEIPYDRAALRSRESRQKITQEILRAFEPVIRQHLDQWYHFVPIWPI